MQFDLLKTDELDKNGLYLDFFQVYNQQSRRRALPRTAGIKPSARIKENTMNRKWMSIVACALGVLAGGCSTQKNISAQAIPRKESPASCMMNEKVADGTINEWARVNTFYYVMFDVRKKHTIAAVTKKLTQKLNELNSADDGIVKIRPLIRWRCEQHIPLKLYEMHSKAFLRALTEEMRQMCSTQYADTGLIFEYVACPSGSDKDAIGHFAFTTENIDADIDETTKQTTIQACRDYCARLIKEFEQK